MLDFELGKQFDVVTCLFSSIGYVQTVPNLRRAIQNMSDHLKPGGVLMIEPWFSRTQFLPNHVAALLIDQPTSRSRVWRLDGSKAAYRCLNSSISLAHRMASSISGSGTT